MTFYANVYSATIFYTNLRKLMLNLKFYSGIVCRLEGLDNFSTSLLHPLGFITRSIRLNSLVELETFSLLTYQAPYWDTGTERVKARMYNLSSWFMYMDRNLFFKIVISIHWYLTAIV